MIIALVIATSACIGLSIRQSAETAREDTLSGMEITANISVDRSQMMKNAGEQSSDSDSDSDNTSSKDNMKEMLQNMQELTLDEMETYAKCSSVKDFYYSISASLNASDDIEAVDTSVSTDTDSSEESSNSSSENTNAPDMPNGEKGGMGNDQQGGPKMGGGMGTQGDFTLMGYSSENAMTAFVEGTSKISDGAMFDITSTDNNCLISDELATLNSLKVGDTIELCNPNDEDETVEYIISGIYTDSDSSQSSGGMTGFSASQDSANKIYTSYKSLSALIEKSEKNATTSTDSTSGMEMTSAIRGQTSGTYVFASVDDYNNFESEARDAGLSDDYTITSNDLTQYENSLTPLENLSSFAGWFLIIVLIIGAIILVVFNIFNIRNRKYEIGVLTAIGMKKWKVALQFMTETFVVTFVAIILGAIIGAATSVPVTNALLENQISSTQNQSQQIEENFGRGDTKDGSNQGDKPDDNGQSNDKGGKGFMGDMMNSATNYVDSVSSATDLMVILELILMGLALTIVSSMASVIFVMRYEPLKILTQRD
jgi:putative ABC transport system permease protein